MNNKTQSHTVEWTGYTDTEKNEEFKEFNGEDGHKSL